MPIWAHVEYDGGLSTNGGFNNAYLAGLAYNWDSNDFSKGFSVQLLYKYIAKNGAYCNSWQTTFVWRNTFAKGLCTFSGFADLWYDNYSPCNVIFMTEPQFWVNLDAIPGISDDFKLSIGNAVEISNCFVWPDNGKNNRFYAIPTLAAKWRF